MKSFIKTFLNDESGASAAEYALILAIVGGAIVIGAVALGSSIGTAMDEAADCIESPETTCAAPATPPPAG